MDLLSRFLGFIQKENLFQKKDRLLLAVSGGVDSIVLCELCARSHFDFSIAHCNFKLRGEESDKDETFIRQLAKNYNVPLFIEHFETESYASGKKVSIQVAARQLRYEWFNCILDNAQLNVVLTAHHLDDNIETMLMNFFKGTGIAGLRGMLPKQGKVVRPLLFAKKEELKLFAEENKLRWVEDSSNLSEKYSRNYLRLSVITQIEKIIPQALSNLAENLERFKDIEVIYNETAKEKIKKIVEKRGNEIHIPILKLKKTEPVKTIFYEIIKEYGFTPKQLDDVMHLLDSETGKYILSASHRILKNRNWIIISPVRSDNLSNYLLEKSDTVFNFDNDEFILRSKSVIGPTDNCTAFFDSSQVKFPLLLRKWRTGDYFYPLGMRKKKKLGRFFIDQKLSKSDKEKVWILEMDKKVLWVVGMRIDDRYKVTPDTKEILEIKFSHKVEK